MTRRLTVSLERLARHMTAAGDPGAPGVLVCGPLTAILPTQTAGNRWQTIVAVQDRLVLLIDEFQGETVQRFEVRAVIPRPLRGGRRRYLIRDAAGSLAFQPLGDYATHFGRTELVLRQRLAKGRFLLALTRDPDAGVRILNGWAIEVKSARETFQLLHSNRSHRVRPVGPIQTDAEFALVEYAPVKAGQDGAVSPVGVTLIQATELRWGEEMILKGGGRINLEWHFDPHRSAGTLLAPR